MRHLIIMLMLLTRVGYAAPFADPGLPFLFSTVDARDFGLHPEKDNLAVRGLCLKLAAGTSACYDTDLMRLALVWRGGFLTEKGVAGLSYAANKKAGSGQTDLPRPIGEAILSMALVPGWLPSTARIEDLRTPSHDPKEPGRGPMDPTIARYRGLLDRENDDAPVLHFEVFGARWSEHIRGHARGFVRSFRGDKLARDAKIVLGSYAGAQVTLSASGALIEQAGQPVCHFSMVSSGTQNTLKPSDVAFRWEQGRFLTLHLPRTSSSIAFSIAMHLDEPYEPRRSISPRPEPKQSRPARWPEQVETSLVEIHQSHGYAVESLGLPEPNPWQRRVRVSGLAADPEGGLFVVTIDGDVWQVTIDGTALRWSRVAGGLHEPQSIQVVEGVPYVFTRTGIIKLQAQEPRGMHYACHSNLPAQTAETREFPMDMVLDPSGGFYIAKGGQNATGKLNGTILHVSRDGERIRRMATGLRQPYLGIHPETGLLTASDQQGNYVPSTPVYIIREGAFYGYAEAAHGQQAKRVQEPAGWIPHVVVGSASGQVWALDGRFGPLNGRFLQLDFNRAQICQVFLDGSFGAAAHRLPFVFPSPLLKACMHQGDGALYLGGFSIWGSKAKELSGLYRVRYIGKARNHWPGKVQAFREGVVLQFPHPLSDDARQLTSYRLKTWNYLRSSKYGSGYYKSDGQAGQDERWASAALLSGDRRSVFLVVPKLEPVMQMEVDYKFTSEAGEAITDQVYLTLHRLPRVPEKLRETFGIVEADLLKAAPARTHTPASIAASVKNGQALYLQMGCIACHSTDGSLLGKTGPSWKGLIDSRRTLTDHSSVLADAAYIRESIYEPAKRKAKGFDAPDTGMPSYRGILNETQVESLILFMSSLK
ncbi:MAG: DUF6797 domain-containing protein [Verrucomicrobiota bacterium]